MTDTTQTAKTGRGVKIALGVSLAVNLLVVGLVAGALLGNDRARMSGPEAASLRSLGPIVAVLDAPTRSRLAARVAEGDTGMRRQLRGLVQATRAFQDALRSEPFDRAAAEAALLMQREQVQAAQGAGHLVLLDELETMSPEERFALADRLQDRLGRIRPRDRERDGDRDGDR